MTAYTHTTAPAGRSPSGPVTLSADKLAAIDAGFMLIPSYSATDMKWRKVPIEGWQQRSYNAHDFKREHGAMLRLGRYPDGWYLYVLDLDSHNPRQQAWKSHNLLRFNLKNDALVDSLTEYTSTSGKGLHLFFWSPIELRSGTLHDNQGHKIGELLTLHVVFPDDYNRRQHSLATTPQLTAEDVTSLIAALNYREGIGATVDAGALELDDRLVQHWYTNAHALDDERGVPRGIGDGPSYKVLKGLAPITDASGARFMVEHQMFKVGYTNAQILGYTLRRCAWNRDGDDLRKDCERILLKLIADIADRRISKYALQRDQAVLQQRNTPPASADFLSSPKRPRGRPKGTIAERLLVHLTQDGTHGSFTETNEMLAQELGVSARSIMRGLDELQQRGALHRHYLAHGRVIELTPEGVTKNTQPAEPVEEPIQPIAAPEIAPAEAAPIEVTTCSPLPPVVAPETAAPLPTLADAVYEAYCTYRTERTARRVRLVVYHVMTNYPGLATEEQITACYRGGMEVKRRWLVECDLKPLTPHELKEIKKAGAAIAWRGAQSNTSRLPNKQQKLGQFIQDRVDRECTRRGITLRRQRTAGASVVDVWEAAAQAEAELSTERAAPQAAAIPSYDDLLELLVTAIGVKPADVLLPDDVYKFHQDTPAAERVRIAHVLTMFTQRGGHHAGVLGGRNV